MPIKQPLAAFYQSRRRHLEHLLIMAFRARPNDNVSDRAICRTCFAYFTNRMHSLSDPAAPSSPTIRFDEFLAIDIRCGTVVVAEPFPEARKPTLKLAIDFGPSVGVKRSSAQITAHYDVAALIGRRVMAVVNLPPRQIGKFLSQVLVLGFADEGGAVILAGPDKSVPNGARLF